MVKSSKIAIALAVILPILFFNKLLYWKRRLMPNNVNNTDANLQAFLKMIRTFESANNYKALVFGGSFSGNQHPNLLRSKIINGKTVKSTAAGAYQFLYKTWKMLQDKLKLPDFSPASQDRAAAEYLAIIGAYPYIIKGDFVNALKQASDTDGWASLPYSTANQNPVSLAKAKTIYTKNGGTIA